MHPALRLKDQAFLVPDTQELSASGRHHESEEAFLKFKTGSEDLTAGSEAVRVWLKTLGIVGKCVDGWLPRP